jgi:membrane fusion protein (multidrug efflux system)
MRGERLTEDQKREDERVDLEEPRRPFLKEHRKGLFIGGIVLAVLALGGYFVWSYYSIRESTDDARIEAHISNVSARVGGHVIAVNYEENQHVEAGAVLVQIDPTDYKVALQRAEAELASAKAALRAAQTSVPIASQSTRS